MFLKDGKVAYSGTAKELFTKRDIKWNLFFKMWNIRVWKQTRCGCYLRRRDEKFLSVSFLSVSLLFAKGAIVLDPAVVEIFYLLNCEDKITAIAKPSKVKIWPEEKRQISQQLGHI